MLRTGCEGDWWGKGRRLRKTQVIACQRTNKTKDGIDAEEALFLYRIRIILYTTNEQAD